MLFFLRQYPEHIASFLEQKWQLLMNTATDKRLKEQFNELPETFLQPLFKTWTASNFVIEQCLLNPAMVMDLFYDFEPLGCSIFQTSDYLDELNSLLFEINDFEHLVQQVRIFRNKHMVRLIWQEVNQVHDVAIICKQLSYLADACVSSVWCWVVRYNTANLGLPYDYEDKPIDLSIFALGKLGGYELNLSSDIDLIFAFSKHGKTKGGQISLENKMYFVRCAQQLIKALDQRTDDGFVYRVDMRLRPYGSSGELVMSFDAMEQYYQDQGRDWERYALMKMRTIAGDKIQGDLLIRRLKPFFYRRYIDFTVIDTLRTMKLSMREQACKKNIRNNIKKGAGGIREIEFIVQAFQLIYGGRYHYLQSTSLLTALEQLKKFNYIDDACHALKEAYLFLRRLENALQAMNDQQVQSLPTQLLVCNRLALVLGFQSWELCCKKLNQYRTLVSEQFEKLLFNSQEDHKNIDIDIFYQLDQPEAEKGAQFASFKNLGFKDQDQLFNYLLQHKSHQALNHLGRIGYERVKAFIPFLLEMLSKTTNPDQSLAAMLPLLSVLYKRTAYLVLLQENPPIMEFLIKICNDSLWIREHITRYPMLLDELLNLSHLDNLPSKEELLTQLALQLKSVEIEDIETLVNIMLYFKQSHMLRVALALLANALPLMKQSDYLTWLAEVILEQTVLLVWNLLIKKYGEPTTKNGQAVEALGGFIIVAYGKLGGIELGPDSDLDLVFIYDVPANGMTNGKNAIENHLFYTRLVQRIVNILATQSVGGSLYPIDLRLRPNGKGGLLVTSLHGYQNYQQQSAWEWEHQALVRARFIMGDKKIKHDFNKIRKNILCQYRNSLVLKKQIVAMRNQIALKKNVKNTLINQVKYARGGIVDIEFLMQYAVLRFAHRYPQLTQWTDNIRIADQLATCGLLSKKMAVSIQLSYTQLRWLIHQDNFGNKVDHQQLNQWCEPIILLWNQWFDEVINDSI